MKKIKFLLFIFCMFLTSLGISSNVSAESFVVSAPDDFGMVADFNAGNGTTVTTKLGHIYVNGNLTYCIEPLKTISTGTIMIPSSKLDAEMRETLSIISFNGYNGNNRNSDKWYAATQIYMWEVLGTNPSVRGFDDYPAYRQQLIDNITQFHKKPSFDETKVTLEKGVAKEIVDTNNVLSSFKQLIHKGSATMNRLSDRLVLNTSSNAYLEGQISYKKLDDAQLGIPFVYQGASNDAPQSIIYPHISRNVEGKITYRVQPFGHVKFTKRGEVLSSVKKEDSEFGSVYRLNYSEDYLKDVQVKVFAREDVNDVWGNKVYSKNQEVEILTSIDQSTQGKKLHAGKYYLKEFKALNGFVLDNKEYDFEIMKNNPEIDIKDILLKNERTRVNLEFVKKFEEGSLLDLTNAYKDVVFGVYTKEDVYSYRKQLLVPKDSLVYKSGIDEKGNLLEKMDLPQGSYYLKELSTNEHFVLDEKQYDFKVELNNEKEMTLKLGDNGNLENKLHRSNLKIFKVDEKGKKPLQATFVLYDQNMKEITEFATNENGEFVFEGLVDGDYFIQEIEAPEGYKLNGKLQKVTLRKDMVVTIKNKKAAVVNASIETNDSAQHKGFELSMLASMTMMYGLVLRKLKF